MVNAINNVGYESRNDRTTCVCGAVRENIENNIWRVSAYQDKITPHYYYRCGSCNSYSAVNLHFEVSSYSEAPIEAYSIPEAKRVLNRLRVRRIMDAFHRDPRDNPVIYDLGAGEGAFTAAFKDALPAARITAVEHDLRMRDKFVDEYSNVIFAPEYIESFLARAPNAEADIVVLTDVLEHILDPIGMLVEIVRVLKSGGVAYMTIPNARCFPFAHRVSKENIEWNLANQTRQHLWMLECDALYEFCKNLGEIVEYSRVFESCLRKDGEYSTVILRRI